MPPFPGGTAARDGLYESVWARCEVSHVVERDCKDIPYGLREL